MVSDGVRVTLGRAAADEVGWAKVETEKNRLARVRRRVGRCMVVKGSARSAG
jgi:hypothetical protein